MNTLLFGDRTDPADGLGRLGQCLAEQVEGLQPVSDVPGSAGSAEALVHCRRDQTLVPALIQHCQNTGQPLLNLSTGGAVELPADLNFLYLECPNISLKVLGFMERVQQACASAGEPFFLHLTEHHQRAKKDRSGTAESMIDEAAQLEPSVNQPNFYRCAVTSVRDLGQTRAAGFNVPAENETGYAIHEATVLSADKQRVLESLEPLEVYGRQTYAAGLVEVLATIQKIGPITGQQHITSFARDNGLI